MEEAAAELLHWSGYITDKLPPKLGARSDDLPREFACDSNVYLTFRQTKACHILIAM